MAQEHRSELTRIVTLRLRMESSPSMKMVCESCTIRSRIASAKVPSPIFPCQPAGANCELKMVEAFLCLASTISRRSRASLLLKGMRSHSSRIKRLTRLYCFITFWKMPSPRATANSLQRRNSCMFPALCKYLHNAGYDKFFVM